MAVLYVVRASVPRADADAWQAWMREHHLPAMCALQWFAGARMFETDRGDEDVRAFVMEYEAPTEAALDAYLASPACAALREDFRSRYGNTVTLSRERWLPVP